ncbi:hypothetical protein vBSlqSZDD2_44 [Serratia phage vB_SlqS_ZDD2]|nr:hypothetical protein vBSlqSZDD2_44 [Serratia phage vB_SlqS_ZDD2]
MKQTKEQFLTRYALEAIVMTTYQERYIAYVANLGFSEAYDGSISARNARFMNWIADRKAEFVAAHPEHVSIDQATNKPRVNSADAFTQFIVSGDWLESTKS